MKPYLSAIQFAEEIGVHPNTVRLWDDKGLLVPHHKSPSGRRFYSREQVKEVLNLSDEEFAKMNETENASGN